MSNKYRNRPRNGEIPAATELAPQVTPNENALKFEDAPAVIAEPPYVDPAQEDTVRKAELADETTDGDSDDKELDVADTEGDDVDGSTDSQSLEPTTTEGAGEDSPAAVNEFDYARFRVTHVLPDYWTNADIDTWIATGGDVLGRTIDGTVINDPTRERRPVNSWDKAELIDGIRSRLTDVDENYFAAIAKRYRSLVVIPSAWSMAELIDYLNQGITPEKTTTDVWINDVTRARRSAHEWSTAELEAWANKQIKAVGESNDMRLGIELNKRMELGVQSQDTLTILAAYQRLESGAIKTAPASVVKSNEPEKTQGLTVLNKLYITSFLEDYKKMVAPGTRTTEVTGLKAQKTLDGVFRYILGLQDPQGFCTAMGELRDFVKANKQGVFSPTAAFRFTGLLRPEGDLQETHVNLINLLQVYTDDNKAVRNQIDLRYLLSKFPVNRQAWLNEFFTRHC